MAITVKARNCKECGTLFLDAGNGLCQNCIQKREEQMEEIASFVRDNPRSSVGEICEALDVKQSLVLEMLRAGRLEETNINVRYPCASCGKMIRRGRYCKECGKKLKGEIATRVQRIRQDAKKKKGMYSNINSINL